MIEIIINGIPMTRTSVEIFPAGQLHEDDPGLWTISGQIAAAYFHPEIPVAVRIEGRVARAAITSESFKVEGAVHACKFRGVGPFPFTSEDWTATCMAKVGRRSAEHVEEP